MTTPAGSPAAEGDVPGRMLPIYAQVWVSDWLELDREHLQGFAAATYLEPGRVDLTPSRNHPLGADLVDGFLLLSLLVYFGFREPAVAGTAGTYAFNYGTDRVRFTRPVFVGERVRLRRTVVTAVPRTPTRLLVTTDNVLEVDRDPVATAMVARHLMLQVDGAAEVVG